MSVRIAVVGVLLVGVAVGGSAWWGYRQLAEFAYARAQEELTHNLQLLQRELRDHGSVFRLEGDRLFVDSALISGDQTIVDRVSEVTDGFVTLFAGDVRVATNILKDDGTRAVGTRLAKGPAYDALITGGRSYRGEVEILGRPHFAAYDPLKDANGKVVGIAAVAVSRESIDEALTSFRTGGMVGGTVVTAAAAVLLVLLVVTSLRRLKVMRAALLDLADERFDTNLPTTTARDEIGTMATALVTLRDRLRDGAAARAEIAAKDAALAADRKAAMDRVAGEFELRVGTTLADVGGRIESLRGKADSLAEAAGRSGSSANSVAVASEQLSASIAEIGKQLTASAGRTAHSADVVQRLETEVQDLAAASQRIGNIVGLITDIAAQTNLLALNATIEAARAGEAGRGFAVVAGEVKNLAGQTAKATEEIGAQVEAVRTASRSVVAGIAGIAGAIQEVHGATTAIAAAVEEQDAATAEIARNIQNAADDARVIQDAMATGTTGSDTVPAATRELAVQATALRQAVDSFLRNIRSAA